MDFKLRLEELNKNIGEKKLLQAKLQQKRDQVLDELKKLNSSKETLVEDIKKTDIELKAIEKNLEELYLNAEKVLS